MLSRVIAKNVGDVFLRHTVYTASVPTSASAVDAQFTALSSVPASSSYAVTFTYSVICKFVNKYTYG